MKSVLFWVLLVCGLSVLSLLIFSRGFGGGPPQPVTANGDKGPVVVDEILPLKLSERSRVALVFILFWKRNLISARKKLAQKISTSFNLRMSVQAF